MTSGGAKGLLEVKKYPNRRFYDTTRSRHVTLQELHDAISEGHDVLITDSKTGQVITNLVLTQILLEKAPPKLDIFPSWTLHQLIRSNKHVLRSSLDRFLGPFTDMLSASQQQFESYMRQAMSGKFVSPLEWARDMMKALTPQSQAEPGVDPEPPDNEAPQPDRDEALNELRGQVAALTEKIEALNDASGKGSTTS